MIKLVSFVVFLSAFVWTWFLFNGKDKIDLSVHAGIQSKMMLLIEDAVKAARPNSTDFEITDIYTQKINDNQISAHFAYHYSDQLEEKEKVNQTIKGVAILNRTPSENPGDQKWVIQSVKTDNNSIEFQEGLVVTTQSEDEVKTKPEAKTETTAVAPQHEAPKTETTPAPEEAPKPEEKKTE